MRIVSHKKLKEFYETKGREDSRVAMKPKGGKTPGLPWNGGMISQKKHHGKIFQKSKWIFLQQIM